MARFTRSRRQSLVAALATLVLILTACSSDDTTTDPPGNGSEAPPQEELEPVVIRFVGDFPPPPFNTAVSMEWFRDAIEERIPGSEVRLFFAGQLYNTGAEALEALASGNLELNYGQFGKDAPFAPAHGVISQPASLTTVGAIAKVGESEYGQFLAERMAALGVTTLATAIGDRKYQFLLGLCRKVSPPKRSKRPAWFERAHV